MMLFIAQRTIFFTLLLSLDRLVSSEKPLWLLIFQRISSVDVKSSLIVMPLLQIVRNAIGQPVPSKIKVDPSDS